MCIPAGYTRVIVSLNSSSNERKLYLCVVYWCWEQINLFYLIACLQYVCVSVEDGVVCCHGGGIKVTCSNKHVLIHRGITMTLFVVDIFTI